MPDHVDHFRGSDAKGLELIKNILPGQRQITPGALRHITSSVIRRKRPKLLIEF
ncbi:hypothetical protein ACFQY0_06060 [Haloferula chungangensis]|uniref:Uncharacterized protein n=1 Tax=Haloferula chungangensis TaxID=1048331 RepID=A0ABW2L616_9BACT